jgi:hypothetical protein
MRLRGALELVRSAGAKVFPAASILFNAAPN